MTYVAKTIDFIRNLIACWRKSVSRTFESFCQILHSYNSDRANKEKPENFFFLAKNVNIFLIRPFLTMERLTHGPKIFAIKSCRVALDTPQNLSRQLL